MHAVANSKPIASSQPDQPVAHWVAEVALNQANPCTQGWLPSLLLKAPATGAFIDGVKFIHMERVILPALFHLSTE